MNVATTYSNGSMDLAHTVGVTRAVDYAATARAVELVRTAGRVAVFGAGFVSIWGASGLFGTLAGLH